jgi:hypothetical protein
MSLIISLLLTGKGFNLFRNFGGASKQESSQNPSSITASSLQNSSNIQSSNQNWFISLFTSAKGKTATKQGFFFVLLIIIT